MHLDICFCARLCLPGMVKKYFAAWHHRHFVVRSSLKRWVSWSLLGSILWKARTACWRFEINGWNPKMKVWKISLCNWVIVEFHVNFSGVSALCPIINGKTTSKESNLRDTPISHWAMIMGESVNYPRCFITKKTLDIQTPGEDRCLNPQTSPEKALNPNTDPHQVWLEDFGDL